MSFNSPAELMGRWKVLFIKAFLIALLFILVFQSQKNRLNLPLTENEGIFTCVAQELNYGSRLYTDVWDHKPPLLFLQFLFIQRFLGNDELHVHLYVIFIHCLNAILLVLLGRKLNLKEVGVWIAAFSYAILVIPPLVQPWTAQADLLMQPFLILAFYAALFERNWFLFLCGVLWAVAFFTKQTA